MTVRAAMMKIELTGMIKGGPHDGAKIIYQGNVNPEFVKDWEERMMFMEWHGHKYKVIHYEKGSGEITLEW